MTQKLIINEELKNLLPPLLEEELGGLEENILKDGCLTPLILWNGILIDGHHRHAICTKHQIPFSTQTIELAGLDDAKLWIWKHQENRRNLTPYQRAEIALKLKESVAAKAKERQIRKPADSVVQKSGQQNKTDKELAEIAGVSHDTIAKVEYLEKHADESTKEKLRKGSKETSINKEYKRLKDKAPTRKVATRRKTTGKPPDEREMEFVQIRKGEKEHQTYCCGVRFEPEPDDDYFDWITDEERAELRERQKTCPNRLVPVIRNFVIQNIPEHDPENLLNCLFMLFSEKYRRKLLLGLVRRMAQRDDKEQTLNLFADLAVELTQ